MEANFTDSKSKPSDPRPCIAKVSRGRLFEELAARYCEGSLGYEILQRNFRHGHLEADIIAVDRGTLVVVEVRGRAKGNYFRPSKSLSRTKLTNLRNITQVIARRRRMPIRLELIEVYVPELTGDGKGAEFSVFKMF